MTSYHFDMPAPILYAPEYEPLEWAKKHCASYITNDAVQKNGIYYYRFYFYDEKDYMWFALKWA